ncbi:KAT8 regulatory NSL complex subunit 1-like protein [Hyla sarda]|uniref:KAT8 regulatory NSL complex subunit 1-like protein n=1 Tax=Hyla sarda TaxID=327740 RepID=UPI0024C2BA3F|nr:KAT8 regulatory NSL complex subunit 1-like protein [Hyla sarda]
MTPALTDTMTQEPGVHFSPSLGIKCLSTDLNVCVDNSKTSSKASSSSVAYSDPSLCLQEDFSSMNQDESLSSAHYQTVFVLTTTSDMNVEDNSSFPLKTEQDSYRQRFHAQHEAHPLLMEKKVKRELFPGTVSKVLADVNKLWDISVTEDEGVHRLNGRIDGESVAFVFPSNCSLPDLKCISPMKDKLQKITNKETEAKLLHQKCRNQQQELLSHAQRAKKRLQLLLAKYTVDHCSQQISGLVKHKTEELNVHSCSDSQSGTGQHTHPGVVEGLTKSAYIDFKQGATQVPPASIRKFSVPAKRILGCIQQELDSDVTESSSDEDWDEKPKNTQNCAAEWNWLSERANAGSRWTWLQAQIAELEYKIHQLVDLHSQLRSKKGTLVFKECSNCIRGEETHLPYPGTSLQPAETLATPPEETNLPPAMDLEMSPSSPTLLLRNIEKQSAKLTEMVSSLITAIPNNLSPTKPVKHLPIGKMSARASKGPSRLLKPGAPTMNGFCKQQPVKKRKRIHAKASITPAGSSARTRPLLLFHKRNLYRMFPGYTPLQLALHSHQSLYEINESWQTSSYGSTRLNCENLQKPVLVKRNVCEIDSGFHPVLSLPSDLPLHLHLESLLKYKIDSNNTSNSRLFNPDDDDEDGADENISHVPGKICPSSTGSQVVFKTPSQERGHGNATEADIRLNYATPSDDLSVTPTSQKTPVQLQLRDPSILLSAARRRVRSESSYDIDNIVIPMNLVAPSKLEKLQYKEILTPSWKVVALEPLKSPSYKELEDVSDEAFLFRHQKCEQTERARWSFWEQSKWPKRSRSSSHSSGQCPENMFLSTEDICSPNSMSPDSWNTSPPSGCASQNLQSAADCQQGKTDQWERRIFPLTEEAAKDPNKTTKPSSYPCAVQPTPAHEDKGAKRLHSSYDKEYR